MRRQSGAISAAQLSELGYGPNPVARLVDSGILERRHQGVYVDALVPLAPRGHLFAALLGCGRDPFLSHRTALAMHGLCPLDVRRIEVTVVSGHTPSRRRGLIVHRTSATPAADEVRGLDGLRVSSPARALVESAARASDRELDRLIADMARRRLLDLARIDRAIDRRRGLRGLNRLRAALARYRPPDQLDDASRLERDFATWLATQPEIPAPRRNVRLGPWEFDFFWPQHGVVVETDGEPYHLTPAELERDRLKDAWVQRHRMLILRVTGFRFDHDRAGIRADLHGMLHLHSIRS